MAKSTSGLTRSSTVQDGPAKDLKLKLRYSVLRVSSNASEYNVGGDEIRAYVEYPFNVF